MLVTFIRKAAIAGYEAANLGSLVLHSFAPPSAPSCSLAASLCSLAAPSEAALLPFLTQNGNSQILSSECI